MSVEKQLEGLFEVYTTWNRLKSVQTHQGWNKNWQNIVWSDEKK